MYRYLAESTQLNTDSNSVVTTLLPENTLGSVCISQTGECNKNEDIYNIIKYIFDNYNNDNNDRVLRIEENIFNTIINSNKFTQYKKPIDQDFNFFEWQYWLNHSPQQSPDIKDNIKWFTNMIYFAPGFFLDEQCKQFIKKNNNTIIVVGTAHSNHIIESFKDTYDDDSDESYTSSEDLLNGIPLSTMCKTNKSSTSTSNSKFISNLESIGNKFYPFFDKYLLFD